MGIHRKNGYSANVRAYLTVGTTRYEVAKTSDCEIALAEPCELPPGCEGELVVIVDGVPSSRIVVLDEGVVPHCSSARYTTAAPF